MAGAFGSPTRARPVLLATLQVRVDPSAERMAIDSALEASVPLLVVNLIRLPPFRDHDHSRRARAHHAPARGGSRRGAGHGDNRAAELGVKTELLRVRTKRPVQALLQVAGERDAGLIVFGPHLGRVGRMRFRRAAKRIRREATCLVWVAPDG